MKCEIKASGIYKITNQVNNKVYIGSSVNLKRRCSEHMKHLNGNYHHSIYLQRAFNKHGADCFVFEVLELCIKNELLIKEQEWMDKFKSYNKTHGYNLSPTSDNSKFSKETIKKLVAARKARPPVSEEVRKRISLGRKGIPMPESGKEKLREYWKKGIPDDVLKKMKAGRTGHKNSPEHNELLRKINTGSKRSKETKQKLREAWVRRKNRKNNK